MQTVQSQGARIHYAVSGSRTAAATVVFLAGAGTDRRIWTAAADHLSDRHRIIAIDHRGSGLSERTDTSYDAALLIAAGLYLLAARLRARVDVRSILERFVTT